MYVVLWPQSSSIVLSTINKDTIAVAKTSDSW